MSSVHNANDSLLLYRRCRDNYDRLFRPMVARIRERYAEGVDSIVDESLEAHIRTYVVNELLRALNWRMGIAPEADLPTLVPESPVYSPGTGTRRFLDYLGFDQNDAGRPLLIVETKRPSIPLPRLMSGEEMAPADTVSLGLQGTRLSDKWSAWLDDLRDYVRSVEARTAAIPRKVVITNGDWIIVFTDPRDSFSTEGTASAAKIIVFDQADSVEAEYPVLFQELEYSRISGERKPIEVPEVQFCVARGSVAKVLKGVQLLYVENPGIRDPPSPFVKVVRLLFLISSVGEWVCVRGPRDIELPSRANEFASHLAEVSAASAQMLSECSRALGLLPAATTLVDHWTSDFFGKLPGVRAVRSSRRGDMFFVLTGDASHYFREFPSIANCRWHDWQLAQQDGCDEPPFVGRRSTEPRAYFVSQEPQHCAHRGVVQIKRSALSPTNRGECGNRSGRNGEAFCEIWSFDTRLCCRTCVFESVCETARVFSLPCVRS